MCLVQEPVPGDCFACHGFQGRGAAALPVNIGACASGNRVERQFVTRFTRECRGPWPGGHGHNPSSSGVMVRTPGISGLRGGEASTLPGGHSPGGVGRIRQNPRISKTGRGRRRPGLTRYLSTGVASVAMYAVAKRGTLSDVVPGTIRSETLVLRGIMK